jgi:hypothetical protein
MRRSWLVPRDSKKEILDPRQKTKGALAPRQRHAGICAWFDNAHHRALREDRQADEVVTPE